MTLEIQLNIISLEKMENKKSVLVTGSSRGLGREIALKFASEGYHIIIHGRDSKALEQTIQGILQLGGTYTKVEGDLRDRSTIARLGNVSRDHGVSVLVNNAAIHCPNIPLEQFEDGEFYDLLSINLVAPMLLTKEVMPIFLAQGHGKVINMNSLSGLENQKLRSVYSASKWGLRGFSNSLSIEAKANNVAVINVFASRIKTKPEFTYGMEPAYVAQKIYEHHVSGQTEDLIIDERPIEFRKSHK